MSNNRLSNSSHNFSKKIAFIGAGNMAQSIIGGLVTSGWDIQQIIASNPSKAKLESLQTQYGINIAQDNNESADFAEIIILSVKPQVLAEVCSQLSNCDLSNKLIISIAAGYQTEKLSKKLKQSVALVRAMPNTPGLIGAGATGLYATQSTSSEQRKIAEKIFNSVGKITWIEKESNMDVVTAIAGSGPAYFFLMMQAMQEQAVNSGLEQQQAFDLITQTALGAAILAQQNDLAEQNQDQDNSLEELRKRVTSPGGTTAAAMNSLINSDFEDIVKQAVNAAIKRGQELTKTN